MILKSSKIGWHFDNSYARLPEKMLSRVKPIPVKIPKLIILNSELCRELGLSLSSLSQNEIASMFAGNLLPEGVETIAQAYAGHQFGNFVILGDGRAIVIGEHISPTDKRVDIQFKGSGRTPYSRGGDGRAALGPMLREYIISEAMHSLKIPTTRSLAVVKTGEDVIREVSLPGAILTRVADSHIRVGTFQYAAICKDNKILKSLADYSIDRHYPNIKDTKNPIISLLKVVMEKQIDLIVNWMRVGFIHGVMNTDNMTISGETIDYGPCAFMDTYNPETVFSSIDHGGRYAYCNQPVIAHWNLSRFAESLLPLIDSNQDKAIELAKKTINEFNDNYKKKWIGMMCKKIGIFEEEIKDETLINDLLLFMKSTKLDYTNTFNLLMQKDPLKNKLFQNDIFINWYKRWEIRLNRNKKSNSSSLDLMRANNPVIIPRNYRVEEALEAATINGDLKPLHKMLEALKNPYEDSLTKDDYKSPSEPNEIDYKTYCGT